MNIQAGRSYIALLSSLTGQELAGTNPAADSANAGGSRLISGNGAIF